MNLEDIKGTVEALASDASRIRDAARHFFIPKEDSKEAKDMERMAAASYAIEVVVSLVNIFSALRSPGQANTFLAISDLTITLNTNPFWVRNAGHLTPLLIAAVNAAEDARELSVSAEPAWQSLETQSRNMWLEILPTLLFLCHGTAMMRLRSTEIKKTFAGLLGAI